MTKKSSPSRAATDERLDVRVMLDPHMGPIYAILATLPKRLRGRELLALARLSVGMGNSPAVRMASQAPAVEPAWAQPMQAEPRGSELAGEHLDRLGGFADATPPLH